MWTVAGRRFAQNLDEQFDVQGPSPARMGEWRLKLIHLDVTPRQLECLRWASRGKTACEIGLILGISSRTVETHLSKVCQALGVRTRIEAVRRACDLELIENDRP